MLLWPCTKARHGMIKRPSNRMESDEPKDAAAAANQSVPKAATAPSDQGVYEQRCCCQSCRCERHRTSLPNGWLRACIEGCCHIITIIVIIERRGAQHVKATRTTAMMLTASAALCALSVRCLCACSMRMTARSYDRNCLLIFACFLFR